MNVASTWYYVDQSAAQVGPVDVNAIRNLVQSGAVDNSTLFWTDGQLDWLALGDLPALKSKVTVAPPPRRDQPAPPPPPAAGRPKSSRQPASGSSGFGYGAAPQPNMQTAPGRGGAGGNPAPPAGRPQQSGGWMEKLTADGVPYYYNPASEAVSWEKPDCLKTAAELESDSNEWVWVTDPEEGWIPAKVISKSATSAQVQPRTGPKKTVDPRQEPMWPLFLTSLNRIEDDLVMVDQLNMAMMMYCLKERYKVDQIYTWVGANHSVLVSVNPFKQLPIYTVKIMQEFATSSPNRLTPPHTFAIANDSYLKLCLEHVNQAILISGESGAGKTEATKQCLNFLAEIAGSVSNVEQKILNANPVLEAFGNAKTLRNNNSSRFGKWMEIHFDTRGSIIGARIENYLLEKSRVVYQAQGERSYHIFYQLCAGELARSLELGSPEQFRYLNQSGCTSVQGIDDIADLQDVRNAFVSLNFDQREVSWIFELVAGVLHLGNVTFASDGDQGSVVDPNGARWLQTAARYLKVDPGELTLALTTRTIEVRGDVTRLFNKVQEAYEAADALSKAAYNKMFDWLVQRINSSVQGQQGRFIGVLDIFGFEIFKKNSFEQLCINFTNEKLQQHFNKHTFKEEEETYMSEGIFYNPIVFIDNQPVLDLIESKPYGILNLLDEEVKMPKGGDDKWLSKCHQAQSGHPNWNQGARPGMPPSNFVINHYAGLVIYDSTGFVEKNRDSLFRDLYDCIAASPHPITQLLFPPKDKNPRRMTTLGGDFRKQLTDLMVLVDGCEPHYIRCVKANDEKRGNLFKTRMCTEQLTYAGVFEAVQIRKQGYPFRLPHMRFVARYRPLMRKDAGWLRFSSNDPRTMCDNILRCVNQDFSQIQVGHTMILYRADEHRILELLRNLSLDRILPTIQRIARRKIGKKFFVAIRQVNQICKRGLDVGNDVPLLDRCIAESMEVLARFIPIYNWLPHSLVAAKDLRFRLEERVKLGRLFRELVNKNPEQNFGEFVDAVKRADAIRDFPASPEDNRLEARIRELLLAACSAKIDPWAQEAHYLLDKPQMTEVVTEAEKLNYNTPELDEIRGKLRLPEPEFVKLQLRRANEMGDPDRIINREIRLKEIYLEAHGSLFSLDRCTLLRDRVDWANSKFFAFNKDDMIASFLRHTVNPIHQSLTQLDGPLAKEAVRMFKNMMGYMGDRKYQYPETLAQEIVATCLQTSGIRSEIYIQLMKQLIDNPNQESVDKGWELMAIFLACFPPPENVENFLSMFIRKKAPADKRDQFIIAIHMVIYGGARATPPSIQEIPLIVADFFHREVTARYASEDVVRARGAPGARAQAQAGGARGAAAAQSTARGGAAAGMGVAASTRVQAATSSPVIQPAAAAAPAPPPPPSSARTAVALFDYLPGGQEGMLEIRKGDVVTLVNTDDNDWWMASLGARQGWIPANYVRSN